MRKLDFVSGAPQFAIFKEGANKTNFGGVIYLIYIIILVLLAIIYIYDYAVNDRYEFNYTYVKKSFEEIINSDEDEHLNIDLRFHVYLNKDSFTNPESLENNPNFKVIDVQRFTQKYIEQAQQGIKEYLFKDDDDIIIKPDSYYTKKLKDIQLAVVYKCNGGNYETDCYIREDDKVKEDQMYNFVFGYEGFSIDHQNTNKPLFSLKENNEENNGIYLWAKPFQFFEQTNLIYMNWEKIEYEEEKGIFGKTYDRINGNDNTYYGGEIKSVELYPDDGHMRKVPANYHVKDLDGNTYMMLLYVQMYPNQLEYDKYSRKAISFLDVLADISALASTALDLMALAYGFLYSENYDNYKIVENILSEKMRLKLNNKIIESEEPKIELKTDLIESNEEKEIKSEEKEDIITEEKQKSGKSVDFLSPNFFDFLFHKLYFTKLFGPSKKQALIESCNDVIAKYITIDSIIYNQIRLENLLKDYKWNNPQNEFKQSDDFILELQEK
jgi:hypothetical protein